MIDAIIVVGLLMIGCFTLADWTKSGLVWLWRRWRSPDEPRSRFWFMSSEDLPVRIVKAATPFEASLIYAREVAKSHTSGCFALSVNAGEFGEGAYVRVRVQMRRESESDA